MATLSDIDINALQPNGRKSSLPLDSDEDEDYDTAVGLKPQKMKNSFYMEYSNEEENLSPLEHDNGKNKNEYSSRSSIKKNYLLMERILRRYLLPGKGDVHQLVFYVFQGGLHKRTM